MTTPFASTIENGIAELVLNNPPVNAFGCDDQFAMADEIRALGQNPDVRVIVIRAEGKGFHAGLDIKEMAAAPERIVEANQSNYDTYEAVHLNPKPVIAAVHGFVLGGGIGITGSADIIVAADDASFGVPEVDRGGLGMGAHLQRMFPVQKVRYMYFTGEFIDAAEAYRLGAVERVVPREELRAAAMEIAEKIAAKSPEMIRLAKKSLTGSKTEVSRTNIGGSRGSRSRPTPWEIPQNYGSLSPAERAPRAPYLGKKISPGLSTGYAHPRASSFVRLGLLCI